MAHITGGGIAGNLCRSINKQVDAWINLDSITIPTVFDFLQKRGGVETEEMFKVFNMGIGYTIIVRPEGADSLCQHLKTSGEKPVVIGKIRTGTGKVRLTN